MFGLSNIIPKKPQLRPASRDEVVGIARPLWTLLYGYENNRTDPGIDLILSGALSLVANLSYCAINADEREQQNRAKLIPCLLYQRLLLGDDFDFIELMGTRVDHAGTTIIRTKFFVAVVVPANERILVGIRGTQFAYDWVLNLWATKRQGFDGRTFHTGFYREAEALGSLLKDDLDERYALLDKKNKPPILFLSGHSLGGAVAAILNQMSYLPRAASCYTFGTPRISSKQALILGREPIAIRRELDIVPHCPPRFLNYGEYNDQRRVDGTRFKRIDAIEIHFFLSWLTTMALRSFPANHSMDLYVEEIISFAKRHPAVAQGWNSHFDELWPYTAGTL